MKLTVEQETELRRFPASGGWVRVSINRAGTMKRGSVLRQQLKRKGLLAQDAKVRRLWKRTPAGCELVP